MQDIKCPSPDHMICVQALASVVLVLYYHVLTFPIKSVKRCSQVIVRFLQYLLRQLSTCYANKVLDCTFMWYCLSSILYTMMLTVKWKMSSEVVQNKVSVFHF